MSRRWFCSACRREWIYSYRWTAEQGCPLCQSAAIREVEYRPAFVGADLPRDASGNPVLADTAPVPAWAEVTLPAPVLALAADEWEEDDASITG